MKIKVTQCSMCRHYSKEKYCEVWDQYIANDAFYCACGTQADHKTELITHDDYIKTENDHLEARCLNCNNAKACKEKHWEGCVYEPKDEKTCETCRHWKFIAKEWQCEACKCQGYEPKTEPQACEK